MQLASNPGTGFTWQLTDQNSDNLQLIGNPVLDPPTPNQPGNIIYQIFRFKVESHGNSKLILKYNRAGSNDQYLDNYEVNIEASESSANITLTESDNNKEIKLVKNDMFSIELPSNPSTGRSWQVSKNNSSHTKLIENIQIDSPNSNYPGKASYQKLKFQVQSSDESLLELQYKQPQSTSVEARYTIPVTTLEPSDLIPLTESDNKRDVRSIPGNIIIIRLPINQGTGYTWQVVENDPNLVKMLEQPTLEQIGVQYKNFCFKAQSSGYGILEFHYLRPWEKNKPPLNVYRLSVEIR